MSISMSWFAVAHKTTATIFKNLTLADTGEPASFGTSKIMGVMLPNDWYLIVLDEFWHPFIRTDDSSFIRLDPMLNLSYNRGNDCEVVGCSESESTNSSLAFYHRKDNQVWRVGHVLDEGVDHFDVEGTLPEGFEIKLAEAIKLSQQEHYDAVYSLPARLAEEVCGFHYDQLQSLKFTELVQIPKISATTMHQTICARLEPLLESWGFIKNAKGDWVATSANEEITCHFFHNSWINGGGYFDLRFEVRNFHIEAIGKSFVLEYFKETNDLDRLTYRRYFCRIFSLDSSILTEEDLTKWLAQTEAKLPVLIAGFKDIKTLEALTNDGSPRYDFFGNPTLRHIDGETGCARLILAYLMGNPNFDQMIAESDSTGEVSSTYAHDLAAYLRKNVNPLVKDKSLKKMLGKFFFVTKLKQFFKRLMK